MARNQSSEFRRKYNLKRKILDVNRGFFVFIKNNQ